MESQDSAGPEAGIRKPPQVLQAGSIWGFLHKIPAHQVKPEPGEATLQRWEAQWQEFLRKMESPHSAWGAPQSPEEPTPWADTEGFLASFEQVAKACRWPRKEWVARLLPALSGEAEWAFRTLEMSDREDYGKVKAAILRGDALSREEQRQRFRRFCYQAAQGPREAYKQLQELCQGWLKVDRHTKEQILELLILEQFLTILPLEIQSWVRKQDPETCSQAVALAEDFLLRQQVAAQDQDQQALVGEASPLPEEEQDLSDAKGMVLCTATKAEAEGEAVGSPVDPDAGELDNRTVEDFEQEGPRSEDVLEISSGSSRENLSFSMEIGGGRLLHMQGEESPEIPSLKSEHWNEVGIYRHQEEAEMQSEEQKQKWEMKSGASSAGDLCQTTAPQRLYKGTGRKQCPVCGKIFTTQSSVNRHLRIHTGERPYKCSYCGKTFNQRVILTNHEKIHTDRRLSQCSDGGDSFSSKANITGQQIIYLVASHDSYMLPSGSEAASP
ncbi:zinc finger and SCAN domain-containing protein 31-like [Rhineura floridana]|uniref:zinc finger and SCAN domain-containing protein 31-like n=1 Tax=Rhineura floridana TaxID=261503 RepID=UPI002AC8150A|nr:zinc finger and SCAN domain-containing protein 31-like [Rhineura floridana]XP_061476282.1 zinc finger and SCAN domain-containing protein 31-like [Rhineura floridana]XP_061476283.1 zinc finger and SCAN domain-containing protein 31-like [Rhineura floridana]XP_061476284.1 zinc finger and SCAN domain-containing protein 31-like [Rhineura floridana]XP_061476285.1 zinc finger and SCAN domain-containing protein 31-like [Rhineura floridana]XP_061476286.1 zinc finger and SCAN domain-containing protei